MRTFIGRSSEIETIKRQLNQESSRIVVIYGRRRIGKSTLAKKIAEGYNFFEFSGLAPEECSADRSKDQIQNFVKQLSQKTKKDYEIPSDWFDALYLLNQEIPDDEKTVVLFDEISWMGLDDRNFVGKLKIWWDTEISQKNVLLIFSGSVSTWIEKNIINSTAFYGRISAFINLQPLSISESVTLLKKKNFHGSPFEFYRILAVTGGVPWYLEQINPTLTADKNIENLCFRESGILRNEFDKIFNDVFSRHGDVYHKILNTLSTGMKTLSEIRENIDYSHSGRLSDLMENLVICGFVTKHQQWSFKTKKRGKQSIYRISDPYIRFYLKYIKSSENRLPKNFNSIMGIQMETLLIQNKDKILELLNLKNTLVADGPYVQKPTVRKKGCQIDYLIQTETSNLYLCEFKFQTGCIEQEIIEEIQEKMKRLSLPKGMALVPVLFHIAEVSEPVYLSNFFYRIIDLCDLLEE